MLCIGLAAVAALAGCTNNDAGEEDFNVPTAITVDPLVFLGDVPCSNEPGSMRSYVATLVDWTDAKFILPSSPPTPCSQRVSFRYVVDGHLYTAEIDGYEAPAHDLAPAFGPMSGSRHMLDAAGDEVLPRWTTTCGKIEDEGATAAIDSTNVVLGVCDPLHDSGSMAATAVRVDPSLVLGKLGCASQGGLVASFDVLPDGGLAPVLGVACPPAAPIEYNAGIVPGQVYTFRIEATDEAGAATFGAACSAVAADGITVIASCDPLSATGALDIPIASVLAGAGLTCGGDAASYVATLSSEPPLKTQVLGCDEGSRFSPLEPGLYQASVEIRGPDGAPVATAACAGEVLAGAATTATCASAP